MIFTNQKLGIEFGLERDYGFVSGDYIYSCREYSGLYMVVDKQLHRHWMFKTLKEALDFKQLLQQIGDSTDYQQLLHYSPLEVAKLIKH